MPEEFKPLKKWIALIGEWQFTNATARYLKPPDGVSVPLGIALSEARLRTGTIKAHVQLSEHSRESEGRIIFGYSPQTKDFYVAGIGGHGYGYVLVQFVPTIGYIPIAGEGSNSNFVPKQEYDIELRVRGQRAVLLVNGTKVIDHNLPQPLSGDQVGLNAVGYGGVEFKDVYAFAKRPRIFVIMQFGEPYDALYTDVIRPVAEEKGLEAFRADDLFQPGIILQDIVRSITDSEIVVAEITPENANVFYELGYAHAINKTTILLADRNAGLPFDISAYRVIFYDNTIKGKKDVESNLRRHLQNVLDNG